MLPHPRVLLGAVAVCCLVSAHGVSSSPVRKEVIHRTFSPKQVHFEETSQGYILELPGMRTLERPGFPGLPFENILLEAPSGYRVAHVDTKVSGWTRLSLPGPLRIAFPDTAETTLTGKVATFDGGGWSRGKRLESFSVHPVRWGSGNSFVELPGKIDIEITWEPDPELYDVVIPRDTPWETGNRFQKLGRRSTKGSVLPHLDRVGGNQPFDPGFIPSDDGSPVRYLIITSDAMLDPFQRLADRKTALGMPAQVRTVSWIQANYENGVDQAQNIRNFIVEAVKHWGVEYVLLGGDIDTIPIREVRITYFGGENIPTDMYYACLDGNWNASGNSIFGEAGFFENDAVDLYPDVWVGRATTRDSLEAVVFASKLESYETSLELGGTFPDSFLVLSEVLEPQNWHDGDPVYFDGALLAEEAVARVAPNIGANRFYENYLAYPGTQQLTKPKAIQQIGNGYNLVLHVGHGYRNTMAMGLDGEAISNIDADLFRNGNRQGLLYAINCTSSALDFDCIAEHFMRNRWGGFCGGLGSTRWDFPATGRNYQNEFFDLVFQGGVTKIGEAAALQKLPFVGSSTYDGEHRWTQFSLIYLGDPDFDLHTGTLDSLVVSVNTPLELGVQSVNLSVVNGMGPVDSALVTLYKEGDAFASGFTDPAGLITLPFVPDLLGAMTVGARKHNHWARIDSHMVVSASAEHLYVSSLLVDDTAMGDGDGILEAGETALVYPTISNSGTVEATSVSVTAVGLPPGVTAPDNTAAFGTVSPGGAVQSLDPMQLVVSGTVPDLSALSLTVDITATAYSRQEDVPLYVGGPQAAILRTALLDTVGSGNGNGTIEAGEDFQILMTLHNLGLGISKGLIATLTTSDPAVNITDGTSSYGDLEGGMSYAGDGFVLSISDADLTRILTITVTDQSGVVFQRTLDLEAPSIPTGLFAVGRTSSILLQWDPSPDGDTFGYVIYRSQVPGGPYTRLTDFPMDPMAIYDDGGLMPITRYYYRVASMDSSGIEGPWSGESAATTSLPPHSGYPLQLGTSSSSSPCLGYFNGDVLPEIIAGGDQVYITSYDGSELLDGDSNVQTEGVFSNISFGPFWAPPSTADLDGDGIPEIVCATWGTGYLYVWDSRGVVKPGFPKLLNLGLETINVWSAASLADVDNDGDLEIFINAHNRTFGFHHDGTEIIDGDGDPLTDGVFLLLDSGYNYSTPALADVDNDGALEIIVATRGGVLHVMEADGTPLSNFPWVVGGEITNSPVVADLDKDGLKEIIFASSLFQAHAVNINLDQPPGWPVGVNMNQDLDASPALGDLTGDGFLEVVLIGGNGTPYIYEGKNGSALPGWGGMVLYDSNGQKVRLTSSPTIGNLDSDSDLEICFGGGDGNLYAFNLDLTPVDGFPIGTPNSIDRGAVLWDIDGDGLTEVVAQSFDERLYVWDSPGVFDPNNQPWPLFAGNSRRTGEYGQELWTYIGTQDIEPVRLVLGANHPNPFRIRTEIRVYVPSAKGIAPANLSIYDIQGRLVQILYAGPLGPGEASFSWNGLAANGRRLGSGVYFYRLETADTVETRKMVLLP